MRKRENRSEAGQVLVEFVIVFSMIATLIFLFVQMSWGIAWGHYAHYATYMAARAYLSSGATQSDQQEAAAAVLNETLKANGRDVLPFLAPSRAGGDRDATGPEPVPGAMVGTHPEARDKPYRRAYTWAEGVQYNFNIKMFLLPISSVISGAGKGQSIHPGGEGKAIQWKGMIPFTTDSFLGRETTYSECINDIDKLSKATGINRGDGAIFLEDNGC